MKRAILLCLCLCLCAGISVCFAGCTPAVQLQSIEDIITEFDGLLHMKASGMEIPEVDDKYGDPNDREIMEMLHKIARNATPENYGYAKKDLNNDGYEELILMQENYLILAVFNGKDYPTILADCSEPTVDGALDEKGKIYTESYSNGGASVEYRAILLDAKGNPIEVLHVAMESDGFGDTKYYQFENGKKVESTYDDVYAMYQTHYLKRPMTHTENEYTFQYADLHFVPLFPETIYTASLLGDWGREDVIGNAAMLCVEDAQDHVVRFAVDGSEIVATKDGDHVFVFEDSRLAGRVEVGHRTLRLVITRSEIPNISVRAYILKKI